MDGGVVAFTALKGEIPDFAKNPKIKIRENVTCENYWVYSSGAGCFCFTKAS